MLIRLENTLLYIIFIIPMRETIKSLLENPIFTYEAMVSYIIIKVMTVFFNHSFITNVSFKIITKYFK